MLHFVTTLLFCLVPVLALRTPPIASFDLARAEVGIFLSKISYCDEGTIATWSCTACAKFPSVINVTVFADAGHDSQGFVAYAPRTNEIFMVFRGTVNIQGWIEDADFFQMPYEPDNCTGCLVHEGLYKGYQRVSATLLPALQDLVSAHPAADIQVSGHSMGAAQAGFAFPDVVRKIRGHFGAKRMYTFGSPRLGNPAFVKWLETIVEPHHEHFRATNYGDPIPHLAPISFDELGLGNWLHQPREVFFRNPFVSPATPGNMKVCAGNTTAEDPTCADSTPWFAMLSFRNHTTYLNHGLGCFL